MGELHRENLDRLVITVGGGPLALGCNDHPDAGTTAMYAGGYLRLLCRGCGFEAAKVAVALKPKADAADEVSISLDPECIQAENISEFYPEATGPARAALEHMLTPDTRDHRDADILAACAVSEALIALVAVKKAEDA